MNRRHIVVILMTIVLSVGVVLATLFLVRKFAANVERNRNQQQLAADAERMAGLDDYMVYYIGEPSSEVISTIPNLTVIAPGMMNRNTLPVAWSDIHFVELDEAGNVINEVEPRDYAKYMLIYVDSDVTLTEDQLELLRDCNIDNDVPLIIEGEANINAYREYIFMVPHDLGANATSMFTPWEQPQDNVIPEETVTGGQAGFVNALVDVILSNAEQIDIYRAGTLVEIETEASETTAEETEETEEEEETDTT